METYVQQGKWPGLHIWATMWTKNETKFIFGGPGNACGRTSIIRLCLSLCASIISFMLIYMSKQSVRIYHLIYVNLHGSNLIRTLLINPKYEKHGILSYFLGPERGGGFITLNPGVPRCPQMQTSSYWRHMYNKVNNK